MLECSAGEAMNYPGNIVDLTTEQILQHYNRNGLKPARKASMNAMIKEQLLSLKETRAFYTDLVNRGIFEDDGGGHRLGNAIDELEHYVRYLNGFDHT